MKKKEIRKIDDMKLIFYIQDINRSENEDTYSDEFKKLVRDEVCRRGEKK